MNDSRTTGHSLLPSPPDRPTVRLTSDHPASHLGASTPNLNGVGGVGGDGDDNDALARQLGAGVELLLEFRLRGIGPTDRLPRKEDPPGFEDGFHELGGLPWLISLIARPGIFRAWAA